VGEQRQQSTPVLPQLQHASLSACTSVQLHERLVADLAEDGCATAACAQVYLCDDRLCYHEPEPATLANTDAAHSPASMHSRVTAAAMISASMDGSPTLPLVGYYGTVGSTASSLAALAAGEVRYIALDRIPVRPLPHRQHELDPFERSHPDVGITIISDG